VSWPPCRLHRLAQAPVAPRPGGLAGLAVDAHGTVYLADRAEHVVLRLAPDGSPSTYAGSGDPGSSGDGGAATGARLEMPTGLALDSKGDLYIADAGNNRVRKVDAATGTITTVAGSQDVYGYGGDGGPAIRARLSLPSGIAVDRGGDLYVADTGNNRVRKVTRDGIITTVAGSGSPGLAGEGGPASGAELFGPRGLAFDRAGDLYIADEGNNRVRKLSLRRAGGGS
jgi:NHL repeat